ncbi:replication protein P, partial [Klebsiella pneumoniae]|uniref:replication protein P n=1 Tax=Klebsiella pneumoniae TaxID=573 RepID=UPI0039687745
SVKADVQTRGEVDRWFLRIKAICPGWRSSWPSDEVENAAKAEWLAEIVRQQVTRREQLQAGVRRTSL